MDFLQFQQRVANILDAGLPAASPVVSEGQSIAKDVEIGRTAFMDKMGVDSEKAYKRQCIRDGEIMFHAHIGLGSWEATAQALTYIYNIAERSDFVIDRAGMCLDRRMGVPAMTCPPKPAPPWSQAGIGCRLAAQYPSNRTWAIL